MYVLTFIVSYVYFPLLSVLPIGYGKEVVMRLGPRVHARVLGFLCYLSLCFYDIISWRSSTNSGKPNKIILSTKLEAQKQ